MSFSTCLGDAIGRGNRVWLAACCSFAALCSVVLAGDRRHRQNILIPADFHEGKALFEKSWTPGERSPAGGDGLGPLYNETSCVGCHNQGGTGGGGANDRNVRMLTAVASSAQVVNRDKLFQGEMEDLHPGFRNRSSVVIHRHATSEEIEARLRNIESFSAVQTREEFKTLRTASRNTPALFGAGILDAIPESVLREAEKRTFPKFPEIKGRVSSLPEGRLGRFGWKAQMASLDGFVRAACSNELGLEVPGQHQTSLAPAGEFEPSKIKIDLDEDQCISLTTFLSRLAPPARRPMDNGAMPPWGYTVFESIGCAACHAPKLGAARGIYSDLLLHDMGASSGDSATYYGAPVAPPRLGDLAQAQSPRSGPAGPTEWRTPPLWGVADSAPYLHDGRADTLDDAIERHDGEAAKTRIRYTKLAFADRKALVAFLSSLTVSAERPKSAAHGRKRG